MSQILRQTTVARDGLHNGFTDLQYWQSLYWVSYRKGSAHASMDGEAIVSVSADRHRFREAACVKIYGDNRDPKLFALSDDRLAMTIPTWGGDYRSTSLRQYITFSGDGFNWQPPARILDDGQWLWRVRKHQGTYYGLVQELTTKPDESRQHNLLLMTSDDLLTWRMHCRIGDNDLALSESDIVFRGDGGAWIIARSSHTPDYYSFFCHATPPYTDWEPQRLDAMIHAPIMLEHDGDLFVAGRNRPDLEGIEGFPSQYSLGVWRVTSGKVEPVLRIPAMRDCSYPGLIKDPEGRICMTYYSQHAYAMGVIDTSPAVPDPRMLPSDVYFAELEL